MRTLHTTRCSTLPLVMVMVAASPALAQFGPGQGCGCHVRPEEVEQALQQQAAGMYELPAPPEGIYSRIVRVKIHIVRMSNGTGGISKDDVWSSIWRANSDLEASHILLVPQQDVDYIDSDFFYTQIGTQAEINALRAIRPQPDMMNIYFTQNLVNENGILCGQAGYTFSASQGIAMANSCTTGNSILAHEIGHYWDVYHTHETMFGAECADMSNCATAGDLVCDTEADPNLSGVVNVPCEYLGTSLDPCHNTVYTPNTRNVMSYTTPSCMTHFTAQQCARAEATLLNLRPAHQVARPVLSNVVHLDTSSPTNGPGLWTHPTNSFATGLNNTPPGGTLAIARAAGNEGPLTLDKKMIIYNSGPEPAAPGQTIVVRLGAP